MVDSTIGETSEADPRTEEEIRNFSKKGIPQMSSFITESTPLKEKLNGLLYNIRDIDPIIDW